MEEARRGTVITVFSTASAVGKTLIGINMAAELAQQDYRVCLADIDLQFGDVCNYLHIMPEVTIADAQEAAKADAEGFSVKDFLIPYTHGAKSMQILAAPIGLDEAYNITTPAVQHIIQKLQLEFDFVVVDTTSAFSETNLALMDMSTIITFLGIVDFIPTIKNMKIGSDTIRSLGYESNKIRLVLNRSDSKTKIDLDDVEELLGEPFYHILPNDFRAASQSIRTGIPLVFSGETALSRELRTLVYRYTNRGDMIPEDSAEAADGKGVSSWFKKIFNN